MYQARSRRLCTGVNDHDPWIELEAATAADPYDPCLEIDLAEFAADALAEPFELVADRLAPGQVPAQRDGVRTSMALTNVPHEVGTWSLEYLGPGFRVQLRVARRERQARLDGWISPARPMTVLLSSLLRNPRVLEAQSGESGRFEFPIAPTGACRLSFVTPDSGRPSATPPFWI